MSDPRDVLAEALIEAGGVYTVYPSAGPKQRAKAYQRVAANVLAQLAARGLTLAPTPEPSAEADAALKLRNVSRTYIDGKVTLDADVYDDWWEASTRAALSRPATPPLDVVRAALTDEDEIAHGEAWSAGRGEGIGLCAYCSDSWPCRTQRGIDRLLAALANPTPEPGGGQEGAGR